MKLIRDIAVGIAASAAFTALEHFALPLAPTWKWAGIIGTFIVGAFIAAVGGRKASRQTRGDVMSGVKTRGNMTATIRRAEVETDSNADIMSGNSVGADAIYAIEDAKVGRS